MTQRAADANGTRDRSAPASTSSRWLLEPQARRLLLLALPMFLLGLAALVGPWLAPLDARAPFAQPLRPPSPAHILGTDHLGRDVFSRLIVGSRWTLRAALLAAVIAALPGVLFGVLSGFFRPTLDTIISRVIDLLLAFPRLLLAMGIIAILGQGLLNVALAIGLTGIPVVARVVRSAVLAQSGQTYIEAARAVGASDLRIVWRHIWPNVIGTVLIIVTLQTGWAVLDVSALTFLGLGPALGTPEWGTMPNDGRLALRDAPWAVLAPDLALALTVLDINLFGDALRDRQARRHS